VGLGKHSTSRFEGTKLVSRGKSEGRAKEKETRKHEIHCAHSVSRLKEQELSSRGKGLTHWWRRGGVSLLLFVSPQMVRDFEKVQYEVYMM
jgi:hypothetical protein